MQAPAPQIILACMPTTSVNDMCIEVESITTMHVMHHAYLRSWLHNTKMQGPC